MRTTVGNTVAAGNAAYATIYTVPGGKTCVLGNITGYNTTGGSLDLTLAIKRQDQVVYDQSFETLLTKETASYSDILLKLCPMTLLEGEKLQAKGSAAGIQVTYDGVEL